MPPIFGSRNILENYPKTTTKSCSSACPSADNSRIVKIVVVEKFKAFSFSQLENLKSNPLGRSKQATKHTLLLHYLPHSLKNQKEERMVQYLLQEDEEY